jgi:SlyX protein
MNETEKTSNERLEKLETLVAFQDQTIEDLNKTMTDLWKETELLKRELSRLGSQLRDVEAHPALSVAPESPPPHY